MNDWNGKIKSLTIFDSPSDTLFFSWKHPRCFAFPKAKKSEGVTVEEFVDELIDNYSGETPILQGEGEVEQLVADIEFTGRGAGSAKKSEPPTMDLLPKGVSRISRKCVRVYRKKRKESHLPRRK